MEKTSPSIARESSIQSLCKRSVRPASHGPPQPIDPMRSIGVVEAGQCLHEVESRDAVTSGPNLDLIRGAERRRKTDSTVIDYSLWDRTTLCIQHRPAGSLVTG